MFLDLIEQIKASTEPIYAVHWCPYLPKATRENDAQVDLFALAGRKLWFLLVETTAFKTESRIQFAVQPRAPTASNKRPRASSNPDADIEYFYAVATTVAQSATHLGRAGDLLCTAGGIGACVTVVNVHQRRVVAVVPCAGNDINAIRTHPTRWSWAACASKDCSIRILDIARGTTLAVLGGVAGHAQQVLDLDWSARGSWLVSGAADNAVKFWRVPPAEILARRAEPVAVAGPARSTQWPHANFVDGVRVAREGSGVPWVWTKSVEGEILMWRLGDGEEEGVDMKREGEGQVPRLFAETKERGPRTTPVFRLTYPTPNHWFFKLDVCDDLIAVGSAAGAIHVWHIERALAATVDLPRPDVPSADWMELAERLDDAVVPAAPNARGVHVKLEAGECVRGVAVAGWRAENRPRAVVAVTDAGSVVVAQLRME
ncbi:hypothetical protein GGF31_007668 [Allomyces arbusculus]|nr:hypothetical protein GGF31_007668 [Allomyces arbusculus]